jgi:hypothetical protein
MDFRGVGKLSEDNLEVEKRGDGESVFEVRGEMLGLMLEREDLVFRSI